MDALDWIPVVAIATLAVLVGCLVGTTVHRDRLIAHSADPVATACALNKTGQACLLLALRTPK